MPANILIDCERMKYHHTGLYHYCYNLGKNLVQNCNRKCETLHFFLPKKEGSIFGKEEDYIHQKSWHKLILPSTRKVNVWHATHQDTDYFPLHKKVPVVLTIHDLNVLHNSTKTDLKKKRFINEVENKIHRADHITFISNFTKTDVQQYVDLSNKPSTVIYNGCNIVEINNPLEPFNAPKTSFIFTIGTITDKKNFHVLPALLVGNDSVLIIAGITQSEPYKQKIIQEAIKHHVEKRVIFTGSITENDKQWYFKNCKAFVFPSLTEGFGLPVVEAMYFGIPIFLSPYTSLPEIGGEVCYYFNSFDKEAMQLTMQLGLQHYHTTAASKTIQARAAIFSWRETAKKYLEVYRSLY
jgi:glycosyltransferase involved in cell wall biosynthesis